MVSLAAQEDDDRLTGEGAGTRDAGGLLTVDLATLGIDLTDFVQFAISYDRDGGSGASPNNDIVRLYINGTLVGSIDNVDLDDISSTDDIGLGRQTGETGGYAIDANRPTAAFNGEFAIYRVWREALDANQVQATYDAVHNGITINTTAGTFLGNIATANTNLSLGSASQLQFGLSSSGAGGTLGGTNQLVLPEGVNLDLGNVGDNLLFNVDFGYATAPAVDTSYTLIDNLNTSGGITGEFENAPNNTEFDANGYTWRVNYDGGDGNDVVLTYRGVNSIVDAEVSLIGGVLTVSDVLSDSVNALTISEVSEAGVDYIVISDSVGSVGISAGSEMPTGLERTAPATVRIDKTLVNSIVIQTAFTGDEATDLAVDSVTVDAALVFSGPLTITADTVNVNAALSASVITLNGDSAVNLNSNDPTVTGDLIATGGAINVNTELNVSGSIDFDGATSVTVAANVTANGNIDIAVASPDPAVGAINLSGDVTSSSGNLTLSGTKQINSAVTLSAVGIFLLDGDDGVTNPGGGQTQVNSTLGVTELNGNALTIHVSGAGTLGGNQTGRISGSGTLIKSGSGTWNVMPYFNLTNLPNNNTAPNDNLRNDMTGLVEVREGTLHIDGGTATQNRAFVSTLDIVIKDGAIFHLQNNNMLGDVVRVDIESGGLFRSQGSDLMGHVTGSGTLEVLTSTLQFRPTAPFAEFNGELIGVGNLALYGRYNAESPWILNETGTGTYTGIILVGNHSTTGADRSPRHGLYVNGVTDASDIRVQVFREDDGGMEILDGTFGGIGTLDLTGELEADILTTIRPGQDGKGSLVTGTLTVNGGVIFGVPSGDAAVTSLISGGVITGGPADFEGVAATTKLEMRIDAANDTNDKLVINGDFDLKDTDLVLLGIDGLTAPSADDPSYTLVTWTGNLTGDKVFKNVVTNVPTGYEVVVDEAAKEIRLVTIAPAIVSLTPADDSSGYQVDNHLVIEFNQDIAIGTGNITIFDDTNSTSTVIPVGDAQISISGNILTINPASDLLLSTDYHIEIDAGAITDTDGVPNAFGGIGDTTTWNFTSSATLPPETLVTVVDGVLTITDVKTDDADRLTISDDGFGRFVITDTGGLLVGAGLGVTDLDTDSNTVTLVQSGITSIVINTVNAGGDTQTDSVVIDSAISLSGPITITADNITLNGGLSSGGDELRLNGNVTAGGDLVLAGTLVTFNGDLTIGSSSVNQVTITGDTLIGGALNLQYDGSGTGSSDLLAVTGNLDVSGAILNLSQLNAAADDAIYDLVTYSGTLSGSLATGATGVPANYRIDESIPGVIRLVESVAPTADIVDVTPDPRNASAGNVAITFSEAVTGVDISDFNLTRNGSNVDISGLGVNGSGSSYTIDLSSVTTVEGNYILTLNASGSGIIDALGNAFAADAADSWLTDTTAPTADIVDVTPDPRNTN
ncbi:MAG: Ig-like domain-containing protein, partial [Verrucomicrobiales bacterium]|nr:Ig-like domain-containing protein [Verrucomicrobiales bacterium]